MALDESALAESKLNIGFAGAEEGVQFRYPHQLARVLAQSSGEGPLDIMDVGSAAGTICLWLGDRHRRFRVVGVDHRPELVQTANERVRASGGAARFVVGDAAQQLPAPDASLDGVVIHRLRDSIVDRARRSALTEELGRVVRPGGWVSLLEDMRVEPRERHGQWYARRYRIHRRALELLIGEAHLGLGWCQPWLADPDAELLMSLRQPSGRKLDDVAFEGREQQLAGDIAHGRVLLRGVGIHEGVHRVRALFASRGLVVRERWRVEIAESPPRTDHAIVMKGLLMQRADLPER